jgi:hypothetical protein
MSNQEDCLRNTTRPVHPWTPADGENPQKPRIEKWLFGMLLAWPIFLLICDTVGTAVGIPFADYLVFFGSSVVAVIMLVIALRHYPASRRFLKWFVAVTLVTTILWGGFFQCASLAHKGELLSTIEHTYTNYSNAEPSISTSRVVLTTYMDIVFDPLFPMSDAYFGQSLRGVFFVVYYYIYQVLYAYLPMLGPYYLLVLLIVPRFLALPVFWLWVVLSIMYVVLPPRAWGWMKAAVVRPRQRTEIGTPKQ